MHKGAHRESSSPGPGPTRPLKRGKACLTCRFLKIKCDGVKPLCGPCARHPKDDPCEYSDGPGRSRTRALEDKISRLEARIQELEDPEHATPSILLHNPYPTTSAEEGLQLTMPLTASTSSTFSTPNSQPYSPLSPFPVASPHSATTSSPMGCPGITLMSPTPELKPILPDSESDLPPTLVRELLTNFLKHASDLGFFLNIPRFQKEVAQPGALGSQFRPTPGLMRTIYLWGATFSDIHRSRESDFLLRALADTAIGLTTDHPRQIMHTIQAEVLLAYYLFRAGRSVEAKVHATGAATLALGCGFHRIRSRTAGAQPWKPSVPLSFTGKDGGPVYLHEPKDITEEGERINAFWAIVTLIKTMSVAIEAPPRVCGILEAPGLQIDTPWPLEMSQYEKGALPSPGSLTIHMLLTRSPVKLEHTGPTDSVAKAAVLYHRATYLTGQYSPNLSDQDGQVFYDSYNHIVGRVEELRQVMAYAQDDMDYEPSSPTYMSSPPVNFTSREEKRATSLAYGLVYGAMMKLYGLFAGSMQQQRQAWVNAARSIIALGVADYLGDDPKSENGNVNPIMGTLFLDACNALVDELGVIQDSRMRGVWTQNLQTTEAELSNDLQQGLKVLSLFSRESAMMSKSSQLSKVLFYEMNASSSTPSPPSYAQVAVEEYSNYDSTDDGYYYAKPKSEEDVDGLQELLDSLDADFANSGLSLPSFQPVPIDDDGGYQYQWTINPTPQYPPSSRPIALTA